MCSLSLFTIYFLIMGLNFKISACSGCYDLTMLCLNLSYVAIITVKSVNYHCIVHDISKSEAIYLFKNSVYQDCGYI